MDNYNLILYLIMLIAITKKKVLALEIETPFIFTVGYLTYRLLLNMYYNQVNPEYGVVFWSDCLVLFWFYRILDVAKVAYAKMNVQGFIFQKLRKEKVMSLYKAGKIKIRLNK